ncbi:MAG: DNA polymerase III subunit gamma/tau [Melioribacteraceae bacterium]|jgi:DNA polymerase-3 subunit gamma/tau|nr:DNA polymerase III subunit gamma/tau [Melioribacteraceae bacterium]
MDFIVTARKWRPQRFEEVVGQQHITTTLKNAILNNRIAHAYLFAGPRGCGKTTTARILAKSLNCLNPSKGEPCNVCDMCKSFHNSQSLDIIEIDGASNRRIEEIRTLRESVKYAPTHGTYKVYIIDEVHMLTTESFNALLKTLEEPPSHTIFIFATTDVHKVPLTIISRCQRFDFKRIDLILIKGLLKSIAEKENIQIDDKSLTLIAKKADGALRDAQSLFDQVISFSGNIVDPALISSMLNLIDEEVFFTISDSIISKNFTSAFSITKLIYDNGWNFIDFLNGLIEHFRNIMAVVITNKTDLIEEAEEYKSKYLSYINKFTEGDVLRILAFLNKVQYELKSSSNQRLKIEVSLLHLIGLEQSSTISEIINKLNSADPVNFSQSSDSIYKSSTNPKVELVKDSLNNVIPIEKREVVLPVIQKFISPMVNETSDLDEIAGKWQQFVEQVKSDKIIFGTILNNSKPVNFEEDSISIEVEHPEDWDLIIDQKNYLDKKTKEFFGKKILLNSSKSTTKKKKSSSTGAEMKIDSEESPLINSLITELGAKELKK